MNALKAGVFAKHLLLSDDDAAEFGRFRAQLHAEWRPLGPTEYSLVERLVALLWKQRRMYRGESGLYAMYRPTPEGLGGVATALAKEGKETEAFTRLLHMDGATERSVVLTIRLLQELQAERGKREGLAGLTAETPSNSST